jgi:predicted unusual protein kinase regulating ubiquinone biosynthesis (AarF/ABC1/UbiB family)
MKSSSQLIQENTHLRKANQKLQRYLDEIQSEVSKAFAAVVKESAAHESVEEKTASILDMLATQSDLMADKLREYDGKQKCFEQFKSHRSEFFSDAERVEHLQRNYEKQVKEMLGTADIVKSRIVRENIDGAIIRDSGLL